MDIVRDEHRTTFILGVSMDLNVAKLEVRKSRNTRAYARLPNHSSGMAIEMRKDVSQKVESSHSGIPKPSRNGRTISFLYTRKSLLISHSREHVRNIHKGDWMSSWKKKRAECSRECSESSHFKATGSGTEVGSRSFKCQKEIVKQEYGPT